jgi:hypothetical protein
LFVSVMMIDSIFSSSYDSIIYIIYNKIIFVLG